MTSSRTQSITAWRLVIVFLLLISGFNVQDASAQNKLTHYRVYEKDRVLMEYANRSDAVKAATGKPYRYVESIPSRAWVYSNIPRYVVEQKGTVIGKWNAASLLAAKTFAMKNAYASLRDLEAPGWIDDTYPRWQVYSRDTRFNPKGYASKSMAEQEIRNLQKKKKGGWLIDLAQMKLLKSWSLPKAPEEGYRIESFETNVVISTAPTFVQAIQIAMQIPHVKVVDNLTEYTWLQHDTPYTVIHPLDGTTQGFMSVTHAIEHAKQWPNSWIEWNGQTIWTQTPVYSIRRADGTDDQIIGTRWSLGNAKTLATQSGSAVVIDDEGETLWNAQRALEIWAWNGSVKSEELIKQVEQTVGLTVSLPSWFALKTSNGELEDRSDPAIVEWLHARGIEVHPLLHNQFDAALTSTFLQSPKAQKKWIDAVMIASKRLNVDGLNLDFEGLKGSDRARFTAFAKQFAERARSAGFRVSIDLPRSDRRWDHLTAFDRAELAKAYDHVCIMAYDEHYKGGDSAGSVASLPWVQGGIELFLSTGVRRDQLILGVPFYTRVWQVNNKGEAILDKNGRTFNRTVWASELETIRSANDVVERFDEKAGLLRIDYALEDKHYSVWQEDTQSMKQRFDLAKTYDLHGVAAWRLGYEPTAWWPEMVTWK